MIEKAFGTAKGAKDTSAWIEFFIKSTEGEKVKMCLKNENCYTVITSIAEISNWALRHGRDAKELIGYVESLTRIIDFKGKRQKKSRHFKDLPNAELLQQ